MNNTITNKVMVPFYREFDYEKKQVDELTVYGRVREDFQATCLLFKAAVNRSMTWEDVQRLRSHDLKVCYVYDMLDFENREFTTEGFKAIRSDIERAVKWGFTHILLSNTYLVELVCNEFASDINVILSSLLECNSSRFKVFLDMFNDSSPITHIVVSQNHLTRNRLKELQSAFPERQLVFEIDRWASDIQMVHEHYYNLVYGYNNEFALEELRRLTRRSDFRSFIKTPEQLHIPGENFVCKIGEINAPYELYESNLRSLLSGNLANLRIIDLELWR